jgi:hypothetical protein
MTSFFHDLEDQLRTAAHQRAAGAPPEAPRPWTRRGWLAGGARAVPVALAVAVTLVIVGGALFLLGHRGGQPPMPPASGGLDSAVAALVQKTPRDQLRRELRYMSAATRSAMSSPACRTQSSSRQRVIPGAPGAALLATLGVLRRPATGADRLARRYLPEIATYAGYTRRVAVTGGTRYYVLAGRSEPHDGVPSDGCFELEKRALQRELPTIPPALRAATQQLQSAFIARDRGMADAPPVDEVCVVNIHGNGNGYECGVAATQIRLGEPPIVNGHAFTGVVPDGVHAVTLAFGNSGAVHPVTVPVHDNFFAVHLPATAPDEQPSVVTWLAPDGRVIRTVRGPSSACGRHVTACAPMGLSAASSSATTANLAPTH